MFAFRCYMDDDDEGDAVNNTYAACVCVRTYAGMGANVFADDGII